MQYARRQAMGLVTGAAAMVASGGVSSRAAALGGDPVVETRYGKVRGKRTGQALAFLGIRYAKADRFMPPRAPDPWGGVADAIEFGASAPQANASPPPGPTYVILAQLPRPEGAPPPPSPPPESEDCQYLNVWTPAVGDGRKRPVMLWLHGGFFYGSSGSTVDGAALAGTGEAVVVSVNHRLNTFGFTHFGDLAGGQFRHAGNVGMLDIIAALKWVRDNIERFGGDPGRVMVFGTSGGGMKATFLMASPAAEGLIHRASVQSGPVLRFMEREDASEVTARLLSEAGLTEANAADLATLPSADLLAAYHRTAAAFPAERFIHLSNFAPVLDPDLLPAHPFPADGVSNVRPIPLLIGSNDQEWSFFMGNDPKGFELDEGGLAERVEAVAGDRTEEILALYRQLYPDASPSRRYIQFNSDYQIKLPTIAQTERFVSVGDVWKYRLDLPSPALGGTLGALHTLEGNLLFDTPERGRALLGEGPGPARLARRMSSAWRRHAADGNPGTDWSAFDTETRATMLFDKASRMKDDPDREVRQMLMPLVDV